MSDTDLSKSKIININDFIFKQNLEFYPNLQSIECIDNILHYTKEDGSIISEPLTFDLRTLPGEAWMVSPSEFMDIIKLNKECKGLYKFLDLIEKHAFDNFLKPEYIGSEA